MLSWLEEGVQSAEKICSDCEGAGSDPLDQAELFASSDATCCGLNSQCFRASEYIPCLLHSFFHISFLLLASDCCSMPALLHEVCSIAPSCTPHLSTLYCFPPSIASLQQASSQVLQRYSCSPQHQHLAGSGPTLLLSDCKLLSTFPQ